MWEPDRRYTLEIDSAACENIYGITSKMLSQTFKIRSKDYYGSINMNITGVKGPTIVQVLENDDMEDVLKSKIIEDDGIVVFDYLHPDKYKLKVIFDDNENGEWDTGSYQDKYQPEKVAYVNEVIKVRSNWDNNIDWELRPDSVLIKNIIDKELEEQKRKEALEREKRERKDSERPQQQQDMYRPGGFGPGSI
jgi:hypothetical protein